MYKESYFDGGLFSYIGHAILAALITVLTLGICAPIIGRLSTQSLTDTVSILMVLRCSFLEIG